MNMLKTLPLAFLILTTSCLIVPADDTTPTEPEPASEKPASEEPASSEPATGSGPNVAAVGAKVHAAPATGKPAEEPAAEEPAAEEPAAEEPAAEEPAAEEPAKNEPISCDIDLAAKPAIDAAIVERFPELGAPCVKLARSPQATAMPNARCGIQGRVAAIFGAGDALASHPARTTALKAPRVPGKKPGGSAKLSVGGRFLYATLLTCPHCRRQLGWSVIVDLRTIRDADLASIQAALGYPSAPLLRTARAWSAASPTQDAATAAPMGKAPLCI